MVDSSHLHLRRRWLGLGAFPRPANADCASSSRAARRRAARDDTIVACGDPIHGYGLSLDDVGVTRIGAHADLWEKVGQKLRSGQMPPLGRQRPDQPTIDRFVANLEHCLLYTSDAADE